MKKTQIKDALRNIIRQKVSYFSIVVIAVLGVTLFLGIDYSAHALRYNGSEFYNRYNYRDIEIVSTLLMTEDDISTLRQIEGVSDIEGVYQADGKASMHDVSSAVTVVSIAERINLPDVLDGRIPGNESECMIEQAFAEANGWNIGDTIELTDDEGDVLDHLTGKTFTITGIAYHPDHLNLSVNENSYVLVLASAFDKIKLDNCYMKAEIVVAKPERIDRVSSEYSDIVDDVMNRIEAISDGRESLRDAQIHTTYQSEIDSNRARLEDGWSELEDARARLDEGYRAVEEGEAQLAEGRELLDAKEIELGEASAQLEAARLQLASARSQLDSARAQLNRSRRELQDGRARLDSARAELISGWEQMEDAKSDVRNKIKEVVDDLCGHDSSEEISWASRASVDVDSRSAVSTDLKITDSFSIDLDRSVEDRIEEFYYSSLFPERVLVWVYEKQQIDSGCDPEAIPEPTEADIEAVRAYLTTETVNSASSVISDYNSAVAPFRQWNQGHDEYLDGLDTYNDGLRRFNSAEAEYNYGESRYRSGMSEYESGLVQYNAGREAFEQGVADYEAGLVTLEEKRAELAEGEERYAEGLAEYNNGVEELEKAQETLAGIKPSKWFTLDSDGNSSFVQLAMGSVNLSSLESTFALLFIAVGALVIYATVSKMIDEQRTQIGTVKALGFFRREIFAKYICFGVTSTVLGTVIGILLSRFALESFILDSYDIYYIYDMTSPFIILKSTLIVAVTGIILSLAAVWIASNSILKESAMVLLKPKVPAGAKKTARSLSKSLYLKLILLNMKMDIGRIIVTTVSVAGCCALVIIGFSLRNAVTGSIDNQFNGIVDYDEKVSFNPKVENSRDDVEAAVSSLNMEYVLLEEEFVTYTVSQIQSSRLYVGDISEICTMNHLFDVNSGDTVIPSEEGVFIHKRMAEYFDLEEGSEFEMAIGGTDTANVRVAGVFDNYIGQYIVMSPAYFEQVFEGHEYTPNVFFVRLGGTGSQVLEERLAAIEGFEQVTDSDADKAVFDSTTSVINTLVLLFIAMSAILAGVVLLNMTNIYIMGKMREITIMRINGFTTGEVIGYISRETVLTTIMGILAGVVLGCATAYRIVRSMEQPFIQFDRSISWMSVLLGVLITIAFTVAVNFIALRKIRYLKLADIG